MLDFKTQAASIIGQKHGRANEKSAGAQTGSPVHSPAPRREPECAGAKPQLNLARASAIFSRL
jgi:hypothetical protein